MWTSCSGFYSAKLTRYLRTPACMSHPQVLMLTVFVLYAAGSHAEDSSKCERDGPETMTLRREGKTQWVHSVSQNPHHPKLDQDMGAYILTLSICVDPRKSRVYRSYGKKKFCLFVEPLRLSCGATLSVASCLNCATQLNLACLRFEWGVKLKYSESCYWAKCFYGT